MARDNAACNRAIRKAWERERELVIAGKATRNWTPEQREELISKGKVYDSDGKAFIGQHMKSASGYPEFQGDVDNIQLLSYDEHLEAHKGDWHNVTNWYYNPDTKEFFDFDVYNYNDYPPILSLSPIEIVREKPTNDKSKENLSTKKKSQNSLKSPKVEPVNQKIEPSKKPGILSKIFGGTKILLTDTVWPLIKEHPLETIGIVVGLAKAGLDAASSNHSSEKNDRIETKDDYSSTNSIDINFSEIDCEDSINDYSSVRHEDNDTISYSEGTPKSPHSRRGYPGHRWKKNEDGNLELTETWISSTKIHPEQMDDYK